MGSLERGDMTDWNKDNNYDHVEWGSMTDSQWNEDNVTNWNGGI